MDLAPWIRAMGSCSWGGRVSHTLNWKGRERITAVWCPQGSRASSLGDLWWGCAICMKLSLARDFLSSLSPCLGYWVAACWFKVFFRGNKNQARRRKSSSICCLLEHDGVPWTWWLKRTRGVKLVFISSIQSWIASNGESYISPFPLPIPVWCLWKYQF